MPRYLVFRLYGPMCSWGEIAVGESRHTADHPSRSALLGLFGAALGIERSDEDGQNALSASWRFGLKLWSPGTLLRDYHTVQAPRSARKIKHRTRRQELFAPNINTLLSTREYRLDSVCIVAAEGTPEARWSLGDMQTALRTPRFTLYLGRKSCPLALPLAPTVVVADNLREALNTAHLPMADLPFFQRKRHAPGQSAETETVWPAPVDRHRLSLGAPRFYWEQGMVSVGETVPGGAMAPSLEFIRHDQPLSRRRWQFGPRREWACLTQPEDHA